MIWYLICSINAFKQKETQLEPKYEIGSKTGPKTTFRVIHEQSTHQCTWPCTLQSISKLRIQWNTQAIYMAVYMNVHSPELKFSWEEHGRVYEMHAYVHTRIQRTWCKRVHGLKGGTRSYISRAKKQNHLEIYTSKWEDIRPCTPGHVTHELWFRIRLEIYTGKVHGHALALVLSWILGV